MDFSKFFVADEDGDPINDASSLKIALDAAVEAGEENLEDGEDGDSVEYGIYKLIKIVTISKESSVKSSSNIAILNSNKTVESIYCHWDGYPSNNGKILLENYRTTTKVRQLLALGDISALEAEIGSKHEFDERPEHETTAYGRDRGETDIESDKFANVEDALKRADDTDAEYFYIWDVKHQRWLFTPTYGERNLRTLTMKDCKGK